MYTYILLIVFGVYAKAKQCKPVISNGMYSNITVGGYTSIECEICNCDNIDRVVFEKTHIVNSNTWTPVFEEQNTTYHQAIETDKRVYSLNSRNKYKAFRKQRILYISPLTIEDQGKWKCIVYDNTNKLAVSQTLHLFYELIYKPNVTQGKKKDSEQKESLYSDCAFSSTCPVSSSNSEPDAAWRFNMIEEHKGKQCKPEIANGIYSNLTVGGHTSIECEISNCDDIERVLFEKTHIVNSTTWTPVFEENITTNHQAIETDKRVYSLNSRNKYKVFRKQRILYISPLKVEDQGKWRCVVHDKTKRQAESQTLHLFFELIYKPNVTLGKKKDSEHKESLYSDCAFSSTCPVSNSNSEPDAAWRFNRKEEHKGKQCKPEIANGIYSNLSVGGHSSIECEISNCDDIERVVFEKTHIVNSTGWTPVFEEIITTNHHAIETAKSVYSLNSRNKYKVFRKQRILYISPLKVEDQGKWRCVVHDNTKRRAESQTLHHFFVEDQDKWRCFAHDKTKRRPESLTVNLFYKMIYTPNLTPGKKNNLENKESWFYDCANTFTCPVRSITSKPDVAWRFIRIEEHKDRLCISGNIGVKLGVGLSIGAVLISVVLVWIIHRTRIRKKGAESTHLLAPENTETNANLHNNSQESLTKRILENMSNLKHSGFPISNDIKSGFEKLLQGDLPQSDFRTNRIRSDIEYLNDSGCSIPNDIQLSFERLTQGNLSESEFRSNRIRSDIEHLKDSGFSISSEVQSSLKLSTQGNMSSYDVLTNRITRDIEQLKSSEYPNTEEFLSTIGFTQPLLNSKGESRVPNEVDRTDSDNTTDSEDPTQDTNEHKLSEIQNDDTTNAVLEANPVDKYNEEIPIKQNNAEQDDTLIKTEDTEVILSQRTQALTKPLKELKDKKTMEKASEMMFKLSFEEKCQFLTGFEKNSDVIKVGDFVRVHTDRKTFEQLQEGYGGYEPEMASIVDETGQVTKKILHVFKVVFACGKEYLINGENLTRINSSVCTNGVLLQDDWVRISKDEETVRKSLSKAKTGWNDGMKKCLGYTGIVLGVRANGSVSVLCIDGKTWIFNADVLAKLNIKDVILETGDLVMVTQDKDALERLQKQRGLWQSDMGKQSGKLGTIMGIQEQDKCLLVDMGRRKVKFNKLAIRLVAKGAEYMHARDDGEFLTCI